MLMAGTHLTVWQERGAKMYAEGCGAWTKEDRNCGKIEWKVGQIGKVSCHSQMGRQRASLSIESNG